MRVPRALLRASPRLVTPRVSSGTLRNVLALPAQALAAACSSLRVRVLFRKYTSHDPYGSRGHMRAAQAMQAVRAACRKTVVRRSGGPLRERLRLSLSSHAHSSALRGRCQARQALCGEPQRNATQRDSWRPRGTRQQCITRPENALCLGSHSPSAHRESTASRRIIGQPRRVDARYARYARRYRYVLYCPRRAAPRACPRTGRCSSIGRAVVL